jgi:hypothetical protein
MREMGLPIPNFWNGKNGELELGESLTVLSKCQGNVLKLRVETTDGYYDWKF